jgi:hypothetical protein
MALAELLDDVRWVARRILDLANEHRVSTAAEFERLFDELKWGHSIGRQT